MPTTATSLKSRVILVLCLLAILGQSAKAQLKVGDNPTSIKKSAILELESTRQGLLLPRISDLTLIDALTPPDGMIIYYTTDKSLRLRSNGQWLKIADLSEATANWSLKGNTGTDPSTNFIGTADGQPLVIRTDNAERLRVSAAGNVGIGTNNPTAKLNVDGSVKFENLPAGSEELTVLVLDGNGSVKKRSMSSTAFENAIKAINGLQKQTLSITAAADTDKKTVQVENRSSDSTIAIYLPVQDGQASDKPYGLLTLADWQKIQSAVQTITIGAVATDPNTKGASVNRAENSDAVEIVLHPADATNPGIVTAGEQSFGGKKAFKDDMKVGGTGNANSTMQIEGSVALAIKTVTADATLSATDNTVLANTSSSAITLTLPSPTNITGRIYTIKKIGTGGLDNALTITPNGGTIDGGSSFVIYNDWTIVTLQTNGTNWYIIKK